VNPINPMNLFNNETLAAFLICSINTLVLYTTLYGAYALGLYKIPIFVAKVIWESLTPGQKLIELSCLIISAIILYAFKLLGDEITVKIERSFQKLKNENQEKDKRIAELESLLQKQK